jgi:hypothetical protein
MVELEAGLNTLCRIFGEICAPAICRIRLERLHQINYLRQRVKPGRNNNDTSAGLQA